MFQLFVHFDEQQGMTAQVKKIAVKIDLRHLEETTPNGRYDFF